MNILKSPVGKIVQLPQDYRAFVPNPLPPAIAWSDQLVGALSRADFVLGKLAREGFKLPNPHLLMRPFITREAVLSSKIEGTHATIGEILAHDIGIQVKQDLADLQEVQNYIIALEYALKRLNELPLSLRLIKEIYGHLMQGVRGAHATSGEFRKSQNWIGPPGCTLNTAKFVPPPPDYLMDCLTALEKFLHNRQLPPLIHIALCHYQFETIHPFLDGNGRVGRLLIILLLIERGILPAPLLYLSAFFEATRDEYYRQLYTLSRQGTWHDWFIYFLNGVAIQSEDVLFRAEKLNHLISTWKQKMSRSGARVAIAMIEHLAINPFVTAKKMVDILKVAYSTAQRGILKLEAENIIQQVNPNKRDKVYCATEILTILEEPAKIQADLEI